MSDAKPTWQGLTDEEYQHILKQTDGCGLLAFYNLVEAKFKEKTENNVLIERQRCEQVIQNHLVRHKHDLRKVDLLRNILQKIKTPSSPKKSLPVGGPSPDSHRTGSPNQ